MSILFAHVIAALMQPGVVPALSIPAPAPLAESASCLCCEKGSRLTERHRVRGVGPRARNRRIASRVAAAPRVRVRERGGRGRAAPRATSGRGVREYRGLRPGVPGSDAEPKFAPRARLRGLVSKAFRRPVQAYRNLFRQTERAAPRVARRGEPSNWRSRRAARVSEAAPAASFLTWRARQDKPDAPEADLPPELRQAGRRGAPRSEREANPLQGRARQQRPPRAPSVNRPPEPSSPEIARPKTPYTPLGQRRGRGGPSSFDRRWEALRRRIAERRPELAERIEELLRRSPDRIEELLAEALLSRNAERAGSRTFFRPGRGQAGVPRAPRDDGVRPPTQNEPRSWRSRTRGRGVAVPPGRAPAAERVWRGGRGMRNPTPWESAGPDDSRALLRLGKILERHQELEKNSRSAARQLRAALRVREGGDERSDKLRARLEQIINKQFDTRTEMRHVELERIESQLRQLQESLERLRSDFERRQSERGTIVERRIRELADQGAGDR